MSQNLRFPRKGNTEKDLGIQINRFYYYL